MGRRPQSRFNIWLYPTRDQRDQLDVVEKGVGRVRKSVATALILQYNNSGYFSGEREIIGQVIEEKSQIGGKDLLDTTVALAASKAYSDFLELVRESDGSRLDYRSIVGRSSLFAIPLDEVAFSTVEMAVVLPYIGLTRCRYNRKIMHNHMAPPQEASPKKMLLNEAIRTAEMGRINTKPVLVLDATKPEQPDGPSIHLEQKLVRVR